MTARRGPRPRAGAGFRRRGGRGRMPECRAGGSTALAARRGQSVMVIGAGTTPGRTDLRSLAVRYADLRLRVPGRVPVVHVTGCQAVLGCERNQRLRPVVEVLVQDLMLGAVCPV